MSEDRKKEPVGTELPLDEIRSRLQSMGYLQSPVERFLSGRNRRGAFSLSLRVALVFGLLLAAVTTAGALLADPAFVERPLDVLLFLVYMSGSYFTVSFILVLIPALFWVRRGYRGLGIRTGGMLRSTLLSVTVALAVSVYLLGWWHVIVMESGSIEALGPATFLALIVILLVSLGFSRLVVLVYFLLAGAPEPGRGGRPHLSRHRLPTLAAVLMLELSWLTGIYFSNYETRSLTDATHERSAAIPLPVLMVGIDGLDYGSLNALLSDDSLPNMAGLINQGFTAELDSDVNYLAPQIWNTVSTGLTPDRHGVNFFTLNIFRGITRQPRLGLSEPGLRSVLEHIFPFFSLVRPAPLSAGERRGKSIWEIAELFDMRSGVLNWWASWPGVPSAGFTVSERTYPKLSLIHQDESPTPFFEQEVYPEAEFDSLAHLAVRLDVRFDLILADCPQLVAFLESGVRESVADLVGSVYQADFFYTRAAIDMVGRHEVNFLALYLQGADILKRLDERSDLVRPERLEGLLPEYYRYLDRLLGELLRAYQPTGLTVLVCDPGKRGRQEQQLGAVVFSGIDTRAGVRSESAFHPEDITPTMLYLMGLPVARNMSGRARTEVGVPGPGGAPPLRYLRSYGPPPVVRAQRTAYRYDREMIERLRSLGYLR